MRQLYRLQIVFWAMVVCWLLSQPGVRAQTAPILQWQRAIEGDSLTATTTVQAAKATNGGYGLLAGKQFTRLSATGVVVWQKDVPGAYADSSTSRIAVQQTIAVTPTQDGGFVLLALDVANHYYVTKLDSAGANSWTKTVARFYTGSSTQLTQNGLTTTPDGGFLVVGSYTDALSYLTLTKLNAEGIIIGEWRVKFAGPTQLTTPLIRQIIPLPSANYLLVGRAANASGSDSKGLAIKLDAQNNVVWQQVYSQLYALQSAVINPGADGFYTAIGTSTSKNSQAITIAPNQANDGSILGALPGMAAVVSLVSDGAGAITMLDVNSSNNSDFRLSNGKLPATFRWTQNFGGSGTDIPTDLVATDDGGYLAVGTTTSTDGDVTGKTTSAIAAWALKVGSAVQATTLQLRVLRYDCQTALLRFQTSGGNGSAITYTTPGLTRANPTDTFGIVDATIRNGSKVIMLQAMQATQTVSYTVDLGAYCASNGTATPSDSLRLLTPTYNCQSGALTLHVSGGDGSTVEYAIAGIVEWTTNPSQVFGEAIRNAPNSSPLLLMARQNGRLVTYLFDIKAVCGRARIVATDTLNALSVTLLGNPSREMILVQIVGAEGQPVHFQVFDASGRLVEQRIVEQAIPTEKQAFDIRQQAVGILVVHVRVSDQTRILRVMKQ